MRELIFDRESMERVVVQEQTLRYSGFRASVGG